MKITNFILKVTALVLGIASVACLILAHLEEISLGLSRVRTAVQEKKAILHRDGSGLDDDDDYESWDL